MVLIKKYNVDYCGQKNWYKGAKDRYRAGKRVVLYYAFAATDTDYAFYAGGVRLNALYEEGKGFKLCFKMPPYDIKVVCEETNSMNPPEKKKNGEMA